MAVSFEAETSSNRSNFSEDCSNNLGVEDKTFLMRSEDERKNFKVNLDSLLKTNIENMKSQTESHDSQSIPNSPSSTHAEHFKELSAKVSNPFAEISFEHTETGDQIVNLPIIEETDDILNMIRIKHSISKESIFVPIKLSGVKRQISLYHRLPISRKRLKFQDANILDDKKVKDEFDMPRKSGNIETIRSNLSSMSVQNSTASTPNLEHFSNFQKNQINQSQIRSGTYRTNQDWLNCKDDSFSPVVQMPQISYSDQQFLVINSLHDSATPGYQNLQQPMGIHYVNNLPILEMTHNYENQNSNQILKLESCSIRRVLKNSISNFFEYLRKNFLAIFLIFLLIWLALDDSGDCNN